MDSVIREDLYVGLLRGLGQAVDDGLGGVGGGEHSSIRLGFKFNATRLKPVDRFRWAETCEWSDEGATTAGVAGGQFARIKAGVGDIAATPS